LACDKQFTKQTVFDAHKSGKKHIKGLSQLKKSGNDTKTLKKHHYEQKQQHSLDEKKPVLEKEFMITKIVFHLKIVREDTKAHVERKQALTEKERVYKINTVGHDRRSSNSNPRIRFRRRRKII
jgi:splicing factor 3A subunit 3